MTELLISGILGRMGALLAQEAKSQGFKVVCGVDRLEAKDSAYPVYSDFSQVRERPQVLIDFSVPQNLDAVLSYALKNKVASVLGTTGYSPDDMNSIKKASAKIAIFQSPNMSRGVYVLRQLAAQASRMLKEFDIEIIEKHHNQKADSPSGTALALLDMVKKPDTLLSHGRSGNQTKRQNVEIGMHAVRGGTVAGMHEVGFYGNNEVITLSHEAQSRSVFVAGALAAANWLKDKQPGLYGMADLMGV